MVFETPSLPFMTAMEKPREETPPLPARRGWRIGWMPWTTVVPGGTAPQKLIVSSARDRCTRSVPARERGDDNDNDN
eukprot:112891-Prymnesium_polylepis.1